MLSEDINMIGNRELTSRLVREPKVRQYSVASEFSLYGC